ncbi:hypothetical protein DFZ12_22380 [Escherichia coli]|nr:hypothetical protein [Escherichia coli]EFB2888757.1 hypothetical protein [Escherichia coli]EFD0712667.1 hypothetical protein [Escherichia coli]EFD0727135.1 hypothetical protein [Escherichia coli]EFD0813588.1 hypothetical protein [Escherichia coli]
MAEIKAKFGLKGASV